MTAVSKEEIYRPKQMVLDKIYDKEGQRLIEGWASVDIVDKDNEIIPMSELKKIMPVLMSKGGFIQDSHSNRNIGKLLNYDFKIHPTTKTEGLFILGEIDSKTESDDKAWEEIKSGKKVAFSFAGAANSSEIVVDEKGMTARKLVDMLPHEISAVESPANQPSYMTAINYFAKSAESLEEQTKKAFNELIKQDNPWAICTATVGRADNDKFESCVRHLKEKDTHAAEGAEKIEKLMKELQAIETLNKYSDINVTKETEKMEDVKKPDYSQAPQTPQATAPQDDLGARIAKLEEVVMKLVQAQAATPLKAEEPKPEEPKPEKKPEDEEKAKVNVASIKEEIMKSIESEYGLKKSTTPRPFTENVNKEYGAAEDISPMMIIKKSREGQTVDWQKLNEGERKALGVM